MKPTLEEVKEYFKNAEKIKDHSGDVGFPEPNKFIFTELGSGIVQNVGKENWLVLWEDREGFAKILTTKEKTFSITAKQLMQLENGFTLPKLKEWFPEVFETKLEVGKWYKTKSSLFNHQENSKSYGFMCGKWVGEWNTNPELFDVLPMKATEQEVFEALKNEAVKLGYKIDVCIDRFFDSDLGIEIINDTKFKHDSDFYYCIEDDYLEHHGFVIYSKGHWAKIIPTCTRKEAEKLLNKKIID